MGENYQKKVGEVGMSENRCVSCGEIIPEGGQVCPVCMAKAVRQQEKLDRAEKIMFDWVWPIMWIMLAVYGILCAVGVIK